MLPSILVRHVAIGVGVLISLHYILSISLESYGIKTALSNWINSPPYKQGVSDEYSETRKVTNSIEGRRANAAFVILARNSDLPGILQSLKQMEDRFNKKYHYPYVFLNEEDFTDDFKKWTSEITSGPCVYGKIPHDHWFQPEWIDEEKATASRLDMIENNVIYGGSVPYRNMCRFNSGFFFRHELLQQYDYYWRLEPDVKLFCDIDYDPFLFMQDNKKVYGFTLSLYEFTETIPTLWDVTKEFMKLHPQYIHKDNALGFLSDDNGETWNHCHCMSSNLTQILYTCPLLVVWSNFEIGDLNFWRSEPYMKFFEFLESKGGFYYERWGDAPVHSIGASLFVHRDQIHFFDDIGYRHEPFQHCPQGKLHAKGKCWCTVTENFDREWYSCLNKYDGLF